MPKDYSEYLLAFTVFTVAMCFLSVGAFLAFDTCVDLYYNALDTIDSHKVSE